MKEETAHPIAEIAMSRFLFVASIALGAGCHASCGNQSEVAVEAGTVVGVTSHPTPTIRPQFFRTHRFPRRHPVAPPAGSEVPAPGASDSD